MFSLKPTTPLNSKLSGDRRFHSIAGAGKNGGLQKTHVAVSGSGLVGRGSVRAAISSGDKTVETQSSSVPVQTKEVSGSLTSSSSPEGMEVRAVVTIRKKMKEKLTEKMEDQWEFFVNGIGQGIQIQLISEEVDPG